MYLLGNIAWMKIGGIIAAILWFAAGEI